MTIIMGILERIKKTMGTITSHIGSCALRQSYKVIEMYDNKPICLNSRGGAERHSESSALSTRQDI